MNGEPVLTAILELLSSSCTRSCQRSICSCPANGLNCTDMCKLLDFDNRREKPIQEFFADDMDSSSLRPGSRE